MSAEVRDELESLAIELANAKHAEDEAKSARIKAEEALAERIETVGSSSHTVKCGRISVTVRRGYNYAVDDMSEFKAEFPDLVKTKVELDKAAYEKFVGSGTSAADRAMQLVTVKPAKVSVTLKL